MNKLVNNYSGKRVLVTGHTGFKGSWLIKILSNFGAVIKGYALAPENCINLYTEMNGDTLCESVISDLRDREALKKAVLDFQPDYIFHLAAQPLVRLSYEIPSETFEVNAIGTANLLDAIRLLDKKCNVVLITTDKVYHNNEWERPYKESDRLGGYDPYSASKACCEIVIDSYKNSFFNTSKSALETPPTPKKTHCSIVFSNAQPFKFKIHPNDKIAKKQFGNAVPTNVVYNVAKETLKIF